MIDPQLLIGRVAFASMGQQARDNHIARVLLSAGVPEAVVRTAPQLTDPAAISCRRLRDLRAMARYEPEDIINSYFTWDYTPNKAFFQQIHICVSENEDSWPIRHTNQLCPQPLTEFGIESTRRPDKFERY